MRARLISLATASLAIATIASAQFNLVELQPLSDDHHRQATLSDDAPTNRAPKPLGEWSSECNEGVRLQTMPDAWSFSPAKQSLNLTTRVAFDYEKLSADRYVVEQRAGEPYHRMTGYSAMLLEARVRRIGSNTVLAVERGVYDLREAKKSVHFEWDGRASDGSALPDGAYQIEVVGRLMPNELGLQPTGGLTYDGLGALPDVAEACRRNIVVEIDANAAIDRPSAKSISCASAPSSYWTNALGSASNPQSLRAAVHDTIDDHTTYPYSSSSTDTWDMINNADENPSNAGELISIYRNQGYSDGCSGSCSWNREHTWAKSFGFHKDSGIQHIPYTDVHHLRAANSSFNSSRSNRPFDTCASGCGSYGTYSENGFGGGSSDSNYGRGGNINCGEVADSTIAWEVWPHRRGDVARSILYMDLRYEGSPEMDLIATSSRSLLRSETSNCGDGLQDPGFHGVLSTLLAWHAADPVDADETRRNDQVWCYQGNRNPFIDHPEWVDCIFNGNCAPTSCHNGNNGDWSFCSAGCPCDDGEGDCDGDSQCAPGTTCVSDIGANYGWSSAVDVCEAPPSDCHTQALGGWSYCTPGCPCDAGEGDCDSDSDCAAGLECSHDVGANYGFTSTLDVCEEPEVDCHTTPLWDWSYCSPGCPCDAGQGDCDSDSDCKPGTSCSHNVGANYGLSSSMDVCE